MYLTSVSALTAKETHFRVCTVVLWCLCFLDISQSMCKYSCWRDMVKFLKSLVAPTDFSARYLGNHTSYSDVAFTWGGGLDPFRHVRLSICPSGPGCLSGAFCLPRFFCTRALNGCRWLLPRVWQHRALFAVSWCSTLSSYGNRTFAAAGSCLWNSLPVQLRDPDITYGLFRRRLKRHLFLD